MDELGRVLMGQRCRDCDSIPKASNAGRIERRGDMEVQIMHNGVEVVAGGYHGAWMAHLIRSLRGHHEPQEEALFDEIVRRARHNCLMIELGCFWAYYTNWFLHDVPGSRAICVEPDGLSIAVGQRNTRLNGNEGRVIFREAWIGGTPSDGATRPVESGGERTLPQLDAAGVLELAAGPIEVLHLDIQGAETAFLQSMPRNPKIRFVVVSTHHRSISGSSTTHIDCIAALEASGARILAEHSVGQSFSGDGLIVAGYFDVDVTLPMPLISRNDPSRSLFWTD